ncbi:hypothetical protein ACVWWQ_001462 [Rhodanobacter sp. TND4EL1]
MIPHDEDHIPAFDDSAREHEWLAQETAMRRERLHLDPAGDDARSQRYRLIARNLRRPLPESLPADFAQQLAARVGAAPLVSAPSAASFELHLVRALVSVLGIAAVAVIMIYGGTWLPAFGELLPHPQAPAIRWLAALAGCLGISWLLGLWQRHAHPRHD